MTPKYPVLQVTETTTDQEIFDAVARHLLAQGEKAASVDEAGHTFCRYRTENGRACAVGCLLTDEEAAACEGCVADDLPMAWTRRHSTLLRELQRVHDQEFAWRRELAFVAKDFGLNTAALGSPQ